MTTPSTCISDSQPISSILIVDDHPVISFALRHLLEAQNGWSFAGQVSTPREAMEALPRLRPDAVLLDLMFPGESGLAFLWWINHHHPDVRTIVYSIQPQDIYARKCIEAGASGYVGKDASVEELLQTIRLALSGQTVVSGKVLQKPIREFVRESTSGLKGLSQRELEVLTLLGQGLSNRKIATMLCRSPKTIESHRYRISRKLKIDNGPELVRFALQHQVAADAMTTALEVGNRQP